MTQIRHLSILQSWIHLFLADLYIRMLADGLESGEYIVSDHPDGKKPVGDEALVKLCDDWIFFGGSTTWAGSWQCNLLLVIAVMLACCTIKNSSTDHFQQRSG